MQRFVCTTKYKGPTDHNGSCVLVYHGASKQAVRVAWDSALGTVENHEAAAMWTALHVAGHYLLQYTHKSYALPDANNHACVHVMTFGDGPEV